VSALQDVRPGDAGSIALALSLGGEFLDSSLDLGDSGFAWPCSFINEHLNTRAASRRCTALRFAGIAAAQH
jgi:hypothetical protein